MKPAQNNLAANRRSFVDEVENFAPPTQPQPRPYVQAQPKSPPVQPQPRPQTKSSSVNVGSLYIPPANAQVASPPTPPERTTPSIQSPIATTLNKAPRPWQKQQQKQEELPPWAVREPRSPQEVEAQPSPPGQPRWPQNQAAKSPPLQQVQQNRWGQPAESPNSYQQRWPPQNENQPVKAQSPPVRQQQLRSPPIQQTPVGSNVVWITQPQVFQHPGGPPVPPQQQQQQQQPRVNVVQKQPPQVQQQPGVRIIPIKIENNQGGNSPTSPVTPGGKDR